MLMLQMAVSANVAMALVALRALFHHHVMQQLIAMGTDPQWT
jgi:hypothetical protein